MVSPPVTSPTVISVTGGGSQKSDALANHWKRWGAKPEAGASEGNCADPLTRCSFGCIWQTRGNSGTAKPEAKGLWPYARSVTGYFASDFMQRKEKVK